MSEANLLRANQGEVTTILISYAPQDADPDLTKPGMNLFPFNLSSRPDYVWPLRGWK
ncbi:MAG: hypothetical protein ACREVX_09525 [Clostridium sp.]|uniref:hypothetical protein n=1 Tax=Clostridium sp. TaxID=1506 RepID=UPI003D6DA819